MKNKKLNIILIVLVITFFLLSFFAKDKLNCFVTNYELRNNDVIVNQTDSAKFFMQFDNSENTKEFELSLIELGGKGCIPCMRMDTVLLELGQIHKSKVNIKTFRVTNDKGKTIAKYFGINTIPTQIIMDKNGVEIFRHTGFLSTDKLDDLIKNHIK